MQLGEKAISLLKEKELSYEEHIFESKEEETQFKEKHKVNTTPQIFKDEERVGGYTDLAEMLGEQPQEDSSKSYVPVSMVFFTAGALCFSQPQPFMAFMGFSLCLLAMLKLMDLSSFAKSFSSYDLITQQWSPYGKIYPFIELFVGLCFVYTKLPVLSGALSSVLGLIGMISVFKAVYVEKRDLNCSCVGGNHPVPLGFLSFTENIMMFGMGVMLILQNAFHLFQ